jgi:transcription elongation factor GreA
MTEEKKYQLTQDAVDRMKEKLAYLEGEGRRQIIEQIATARAHGDLSENAEYHAAKDQQGLQESEVRKIRHMLENLELVEAQDDGVAGPGKLVTIRHTGDDDETYFLGRREEKTGEWDILTPESPIGQAIIGHAAGDKVVAKGPHGNDMPIEIVMVKTP